MSVSSLEWLAAVVFAAAVFYATVNLKLKSLKSQIDGVGKLTRDNQARAERRWKHMIATQIETSNDLEEAKQHAKLLREDAWRD